MPPSWVCQADITPQQQNSIRSRAGRCQKPQGQPANRPTMPWERSEERQLLPTPHQTHHSLLLSLQLAAAAGHSPPPSPVSSIPLEAKCPYRTTHEMRVFSTLVKIWSSVRLSFLAVVHLYGYALSGQLPEQHPFSQREFAFYFDFFLSNGFSTKAQNAVSTSLTPNTPFPHGCKSTGIPHLC